jgi:hypothetical protein
VTAVPPSETRRKRLTTLAVMDEAQQLRAPPLAPLALASCDAGLGRNGGRQTGESVERGSGQAARTTRRTMQSYQKKGIRLCGDADGRRVSGSDCWARLNGLNDNIRYIDRYI